MAEVSGANVLVLPPLAIRICQDVSGLSALEVPERRVDVAVGEVNEAIATENHIGAWKLVSRQVEQKELRPLAAIEILIPSDEFRNDVNANVLLERE